MVAAAGSRPAPAGRSTVRFAFARHCCAKAPWLTIASTRSPLLKSFTPSPVSRTMPASSKPGGNGSGALNWYFPWVSNTSGKLTPAAATSISTSPAPGFGASTSSTRRSSIPVRLRQSNAFMSCRPRAGGGPILEFAQCVLHAVPQLDQPRAQVGDDPGARHLVHRPEAAEGHDLLPVLRHHRHADGEHVLVPVPEREAEAVLLVVLRRLVEALAYLRPVGLLHVLQVGGHGRGALLGVERGVTRAAERSRAARDALAHLEAQPEELGAVADLEKHHVHAVARPERHRGLAVVRELLHQGAGHLAHVVAGEEVLAEREHADAERVLLLLREVLEVAQLGERVGDARHRRLGQPRALRDFLVAQRPLPALEGAQDRERARDRRDEVAVAGLRLVVGRRDVLVDHATSNNPAAPCPPPMHIVATTYFTPRRLPSISACPTSRAPETPYGWPTAIAPPFTFSRSSGMPSLSRQ